MTALTPNDSLPTNANLINGTTSGAGLILHPAAEPLGKDLNPARMWRSICWAADRLALSGDLDTRSMQRALEQLQAWVDAGITDIIDVRGEHSDARFVERHAPHIRYHWFGTHDAGYAQPDAWFEQGVEAAREALADPTRKVMVHCHMGVNRGPSMGFAILVAHGHDPIESLEAIRAARPIAGIIYAEHALDWWHRTQATPETIVHSERRRVRNWLADRHVDVSWMVSRIRRAS